jgi:hypothetical protein
MALHGLPLLAFSVLLMTSCRDVVLPELTIEAPSGNPELFSGEVLTVTAHFSDDRNLRSYSIEIALQDEHLKTSHPIGGFVFSETGDLAGDHQSVTKDIGIPVDVAAGSYLVTVSCADKKGNSKSAEATFWLWNSTDTVAPIVQVTSLSDTTVNSFIVGDTIPLQGNLSDNIKLGNAEIELADHNDVAVYEDDIHLPGTSYVLNEDILAPSAAGSYHIHLVVHDNVNNVTAKEFEIEVN